MCTSDPATLGALGPEALKALCHALKRDCPDAAFVPVQLIGGKRWSALERPPPDVAERFPVDLPHRIECAPGWGVMVYGWSGLDAARQAQIQTRCRV